MATGLVQLKLWSDTPDRLDVQCTNCGHRFDALPQVQRNQDIVDRVQAHPRVQSLTSSQRDFLFALPADFLGGQVRMGVTEMSDWSGLTATGAHYHVHTLVAKGIFSPEAKRAGGTYRVYRFNFPNGHKSP